MERRHEPLSLTASHALHPAARDGDGLTLRGLNMLGRFGTPPQDEAILAQCILGLDFANPSAWRRVLMKTARTLPGFIASVSVLPK